MMTTKREKEADYEYLFSSLIMAVQQVTETTYRPTCLVADSAGAITNGFKKAFKYAALDIWLRVVCWQHVRRCVEKHLNLVNDNLASVKLEIRDDIFILQACQSKSLFDNAVSLFLEKWKLEINFLAYFQKVWLNEKRRGKDNYDRSNQT